MFRNDEFCSRRKTTVNFLTPFFNEYIASAVNTATMNPPPKTMEEPMERILKTEKHDDKRFHINDHTGYEK